MKIIVTGSLGNVSKPLGKLLVAKGHQVTVISSKAEKQKDIEALGATAAIGSVEDLDFLVNAFAAADAVYAMVPPKYTAVDNRAYYRNVGNNYAQAIKQTGVKRVVQLSSWGADLDAGTGFILGSHDVEGIFNGLQNVGVTFLRACSFYTNLFRFADMIKTAGFIGTNYGDNDKVVMVHPNDIADAAAEELETPLTGHQVRYVASYEGTANEIARALGAAIGKPDLKWVTFTDEQTQAAMEKNGVPRHVAIATVEMGAAIHNGKLGGDYELHKPIFGKVKLEDFAKEFAAAYNKG